MHSFLCIHIQTWLFTIHHALRVINGADTTHKIQNEKKRIKMFKIIQTSNHNVNETQTATSTQKYAQTKFGVALLTAHSFESQQILHSPTCVRQNLNATSIVQILNCANSRRQVQQFLRSVEPPERQTRATLFPTTASAAPPIAHITLLHKPSSNETITTQSSEDRDKGNYQMQYALRDINRLSIVKYMIDNAEEHGGKRVKTKAFQQFPESFCRN